MHDWAKGVQEVLLTRRVCAELNAQAPRPRAQDRYKGVSGKQPWGTVTPSTRGIVVFIVSVLLRRSGERGAYGNVVNFLLDSRHVLNYRATFILNGLIKKSHTPHHCTFSWVV